MLLAMLYLFTTYISRSSGWIHIRTSGYKSRTVLCAQNENSQVIPADKIAVLIDGDNAEASLISEFIAEAGRFGRVTVKRIYADWTSSHMKGWKEQLNSYAVRPIQKFAYTKSKGSTDTALIIDAMDLLHSKLVDGFCIVSSDSDYTGLAHRIREEGLFVMGIGKQHTPEAFVQACESFTYSEILSNELEEDSKLNTTSSKGGKSNATTTDVPTTRTEFRSIDFHQVDRAFRIGVNIDNGQAKLSRLADELRKLDPTFDHRSFGYSSFRKFCDALKHRYETFTDKDGTTILIKETNPTAVAVTTAPTSVESLSATDQNKKQSAEQAERPSNSTKEAVAASMKPVLISPPPLTDKKAANEVKSKPKQKNAEKKAKLEPKAPKKAKAKKEKPVVDSPSNSTNSTAKQ